MVKPKNIHWLLPFSNHSLFAEPGLQLLRSLIPGWWTKIGNKLFADAETKLHTSPSVRCQITFIVFYQSLLEGVVFYSKFSTFFPSQNRLQFQWWMINPASVSDIDNSIISLMIKPPDSAIIKLCCCRKVNFLFSFLFAWEHFSMLHHGSFIYYQRADWIREEIHFNLPRKVGQNIKVTEMLDGVFISSWRASYSLKD